IGIEQRGVLGGRGGRLGGIGIQFVDQCHRDSCHMGSMYRSATSPFGGWTGRVGADMGVGGRREKSVGEHHDRATCACGAAVAAYMPGLPNLLVRHRREPMSKLPFARLVLAASVGALLGPLAGCGESQQKAAAPPDPAVTVAHPVRKTVV